MAKEYLVDVLLAANGVKKIDELSVQVHERIGSALNLPPTFDSINNGHIRSCWYILQEGFALLIPESNPIEYGWGDQEGDYYAHKELHLIPDVLHNTCRCKTGFKNKHCSFVKAEGRNAQTFFCTICKNI